MSANVIVTFPNRERAFEALKAPGASSGSLADGSILATKELSGSLRVTKATREKIGGTIAGAFIGALAGLPFGATGTMFGAAAGALIGAAADFLSRADQARLDEKIGRELTPGEAALIVDVSGKNMADFEAQMKSLGGRIVPSPKD